MKGLEARRVLVTGGASGIGAATVERFVAEGSRVAVLDLSPEGCRRLRAERPGLDAVLTGDVGREDDVAAAFAALDARWDGGLDVLVNNAGISRRRPFLEIAPHEWRRIHDTNLFGAFLCAQHAARRMLAGGGGVIVNVASMNAHVGSPLYADYNASKAGLLALTQTLALELAPAVRVLAVSPGAVLTPMQQAEYTPEMMSALDARIPLRRHGRPEEIAALVAFLASDEAPYMTGHTVLIDGGEAAGGLGSVE